MEPSVMTSILTGATEVITWVITSMGSFASFIVGTPIVLLPVLVSVAGLGVNYLLRFLKSI